MGSRSAVVLQVQKFLAIDEAKVELSTLGQIPAEMKFSWRANKGFTRERSILYQELKLLGLVQRSNTINIYISISVSGKKYSFIAKLSQL